MVLVLFLFSVFINCGDVLYSKMQENTIVAYAAYCLPDDISDFGCFWCGKVSQKYENVYCSGETEGHNQFYVAVRNGNELIVSFRGSQALSRGVSAFVNWIRDFQFKMVLWVPDTNIKVHEGFYKCYEDIQPLVDTQIADYIKNYPSINSITIIGHSLGASLSSLYTLHVVETNTDPKVLQIINNGLLNVMNFGSPRVGNDDFYDYYSTKIEKDKVYRVVNQRDIVTGIPEEFLGYHHIAYEYYFSTNTTVYVKCDGTGEDPNCGDSKIRGSAADHETYLGELFSDGYSSDCK